MLNCQFPINSMGYGIAGRGIVQGFKELEHDISLFPIGQIEFEDEEKEWIQKCIQNQESYDIYADSIRLYHQFDLAQHIGFGYFWGFPIFELDQFTKRELHHMSSCDGLIVCSKWAKKILEDAGIIRYIKVAPLGVERSIFNENVGSPDSSWTTFINIGKWEKRKGHDILAQAFHAAFEPKDRVRLWMMNDNPFLTPSMTKDWHRQYKEGKMGDKVTFVPRVPTRLAVASIMSRADCGVFPSRAEGWNLEALEMLSMGKRLIITDYSAHTEFCTKENSLLIGVDKVEPAVDNIWFHGQGNWGRLGDSQFEQLVEYMRAVAKDKTYEINQAGIDTAKQFSWKKSAESLL